ncbi:MAG: hypothetical protein WC819_05065 [Parcubacteria group bacterium]
MTELIDRALTAFNTIVNISQMKKESDEKSGGKKDEKKPEEKKPGATAWLTNEDERIWAQLFYQLTPDEKTSLTIFLENLPPDGDGFIAERYRRMSQQYFRLIVVGLDVRQVTKKFQAVKKKGDTAFTVNRDRTITEKDHRMDFLKKLAQEVNCDPVEAKRIYRQMAVGGLLPDDPSKMFENVKKSAKTLNTTLIVILGILGIGTFLAIITFIHFYNTLPK